MSLADKISSDIAAMVGAATEGIELLKSQLKSVAGRTKEPKPDGPPLKLSKHQIFRLLATIRKNHTGRHNAIKNGVIATKLRFEDVGTSGHPHSDNSISMTKAAELLRRRGYPICGDQSGYFYPEDYTDCIPTILHKLKCSLKYLREALVMARAAAAYFRPDWKSRWRSRNRTSPDCDKIA